ncbi:NAD(P)H-dependent oxidoreductase [Promicromonospora thailandica]|uniref:FMN reductase n=1 Tax=Promicromonospora thailandica TaxID=765201 RepID=A0A9X2JWY1_9MICO|nr:NAD(P)H-dependent oxidoreductase [Promicromonospora thailandica]MCP2265623.1 FMN reductase [Promicromonospora thailandica]BFF21626.1 FMN reductase [Promicromonospora thailandica]
MSRPLDVVVVNGSPSEPSKTAALADLITARLGELVPITVRRVDVYRLGPGFTGGLAREDFPPDVEAAYRAVEEADVVVAATPVFRGSYSGLFKHFFDHVGQYALANKPVVLAATGGSDRHALVIEHALRPLFGFFQAAVLPVGFYVSAGAFDGTTVLDPEVYSRIEVGLDDVLPHLRNLTLDREPT